MRLLVDTHAIVWWLDDDPRLGAAAREAIATADDPLVSAATLLELAIKISIGKLEAPAGWAERLLDPDLFSLLPILPTHALRLSEMPFVELGRQVLRDPFDRMLAAQATVERVPVVTRDPAIAAQGVATIW